MKRLLFLITLTFLGHFLSAQPKNLNAHIECVTVFFTGAQVTRVTTTPLSITVEDQIPISTTKEIKIEPQTGDAVVDATTGKLTWKLDVPAGKEKKVKFDYKVIYPKAKKVILK